MHTSSRSLLLLLALLGACAGPRLPHDDISLLESTTDTNPDSGSPFTDCRDDGRAFAVGSRISIVSGRRRECLRWNIVRGCEEYEPFTPTTLRSTNTDVLERDGDAWVFRGPGETSLVLEVDGEETLRRTVRAEVPSDFEALVVAQPPIDESRGAGSVSVEVRPAVDASVLADGVARIVVRPLDAEGRVLCGHPDLELTIAGADPVLADVDDVPHLSEEIGLRVTGSTRDRVDVTFRAHGVSESFGLEVVEPSELTELVVRELPSSDAYYRLFEATPRAGGVDVFGATIDVTTSGTEDCADTAVSFISGALGNDTRFFAASYCGDEMGSSMHVFVEAAPSVGADVVLDAR